MQEQFGHSLKEQRDDMEVRYSEKRAEYLADSKDQRVQYKDALAIVVAHCERESTRSTDVLKIEVSQLTRAVDDVCKTLDEVRDAMRRKGMD